MTLKIWHHRYKETRLKRLLLHIKAMMIFFMFVLCWFECVACWGLQECSTLDVLQTHNSYLRLLLIHNRLHRGSSRPNISSYRLHVCSIILIPVWWFPEIGVPPVIIHFRWRDFPVHKNPSFFLGYPHGHGFPPGPRFRPAEHHSTALLLHLLQEPWLPWLLAAIKDVARHGCWASELILENMRRVLPSF